MSVELNDKVDLVAQVFTLSIAKYLVKLRKAMNSPKGPNQKMIDEILNSITTLAELASRYVAHSIDQYTAEDIFNQVESRIIPILRGYE